MVAVPLARARDGAVWPGPVDIPHQHNAYTMPTLRTLAAATGATLASAGGPCDIYGLAGTPCVAAHAITRALYGSYAGALYQVRLVACESGLRRHSGA